MSTPFLMIGEVAFGMTDAAPEGRLHRQRILNAPVTTGDPCRRATDDHRACDARCAMAFGRQPRQMTRFIGAREGGQ